MKYLAFLLSIALYGQIPVVGIGGRGRASCCTYYVANDGSDSNNGTSTATPWQTVAKVNAASLTAGQSVGFKRGGTWREQLAIPSSGANGNNVQFTAYSTGVDPIFSGADLVGGGGWTQDAVTPVDTQTYNSGAMDAFWGGGSAVGVADASITFGGSANSWKYAPTAGNSLVNNALPTYGTYWEIISQVYIQSGSTMTNGQLTRIMGQESNNWNGGNGVYAWASKSGSNYQVSIGRGGGIGSTPVTITTNAWHLLRMVVSAGNGAGSDFARLYVDGVLGSSATGLTLSSGSAIQLEMGSYGFNSDKLIINFAATSVYNTDSTALPNRWYTSVAWQPYVVIYNESNADSAPQASAIAVTAPFQWYWASNVLYVYSVGNPSSTYTAPGVQAGHRAYSIIRNGKSYFTLSHLITEGASAVSTDAGVFIGQTGPGDSGEASGVIIHDLECRFNGKEGLWLDSINGLIYDSHFHHNRNMGVDFDTGANMIGRNLESDHNQYGSYPGSIFAGISGLILDGVIFHDNVQNGVVLSIGGTYTVKNSSFYNNTFNGIYLDGTTVTGALITNNLVYGNGDTGIRIGNGLATAIDVTFNTVYSNTNYGFYDDSRQTSTTFYQNTLNGNGTNVYISGAGTNVNARDNIAANATTVEVNVTSSVDQTLTMDYNDWYHSAGGTSYMNWKGTTSNFATWKTNSSLDSHSISADPLFTNPGTGDFTLQGGSPAIGAGLYIPGVSTANPPNIGAK